MKNPSKSKGYVGILGFLGFLGLSGFVTGDYYTTPYIAFFTFFYWFRHFFKK